MDDWDLQMYLNSLDRHSPKAECLHYLMKSDVPREIVSRACLRGVPTQAERRRHDEQVAAQQAGQRAALQSPGPIGTVAVGTLASTDPPLRSFFTWDDPWHKWKPWIIALKIAGFLIAGILATYTAWGIFCASV